MILGAECTREKRFAVDSLRIVKTLRVHLLVQFDPEVPQRPVPKIYGVLTTYLVF